MRPATIVTTLALLAALSPGAPAAQYTITDLGTLGGYYSQSYGISESGSVCGESYVTGNTACHAFIWTDGIMTDLGALATNAMAWGVNDSLDVAGWGYDAVGYARPLLWAGGTMTDLGTPYGQYAYATAINNAEQIAGYYADAAGRARACLWYGGTVMDLGTLGGYYAAAYGINESGQVVGFAATAAGDTHAALWSGGSVYDLGVLEYWSYAWGINNVGQVVGYSLSGGYCRAFLWDAGVMTALGPAGTYSIARAINDSGQVVGDSAGPAGDYAVLWDDSVLYDLNTLIPSGTGWTLYQANDINNRGQIVGYGQIGSETHAFLLAPTNAVPAPAAMVLGVVGVAATGLMRRVGRKGGRER